MMNYSESINTALQTLGEMPDKQVQFYVYNNGALVDTCKDSSIALALSKKLKV